MNRHRIVVLAALLLLAVPVYWPFAPWRQGGSLEGCLTCTTADIYVERGSAEARPTDTCGCPYAPGDWYADGMCSCFINVTDAMGANMILADVGTTTSMGQFLTVDTTISSPPIILEDNGLEIVRVLGEQDQRYVDVWTVDRERIRVDRKTGEATPESKPLCEAEVSYTVQVEPCKELSLAGCRENRTVIVPLKRVDDRLEAFTDEWEMVFFFERGTCSPGHRRGHWDLQAVEYVGKADLVKWCTDDCISAKVREKR